MYVISLLFFFLQDIHNIQYKLAMVCIIEQTNQSIDTLGEYNACKHKLTKDLLI